MRDKLHRFGWEVPQHPPYSPDLFSCEYHTFGDLKKNILGRRFHSVEEVQESVACGENLTWGSTYEDHCIEQGWQTIFFSLVCQLISGFHFQLCSVSYLLCTKEVQ